MSKKTVTICNCDRCQKECEESELTGIEILGRVYSEDGTSNWIGRIKVELCRDCIGELFQVTYEHYGLFVKSIAGIEFKKHEEGESECVKR